MIPLPDAAVGFLEQILIAGSAWLAEWVFRVGGVPVFRSGQVLEIPGITLRVAEACSGIRSTWVLFITSLLVGHLFLPAGLGRAAIVALVVPLGVLRNALRIFVIGWLCVNYGSEMIDSWIHRHGGPLFFAASLIPLFALACWLRRPIVANRRRR
jgi:exosortase